MLSKVGWDLVETRGQNINCVHGADSQWLGEDIFHGLGINWYPRSLKASWGGEFSLARDQQ